MKLFDSYSKQYKDLNKEKIKFYLCGPTVYNYVHIGNLRTFAYADLLYRFLLFKGRKVIFVRNYTDVDDKTIKGSIESNMSLKDFTDFYITAFEEDCKMLRFREPSYKPRPTLLIDDIVAFIKKLMEKGYAYRAKDESIYFKVSAFKNYGKLSGIKIKKLKESVRISLDEYDKEEAKDFVLWKAYSEKDGPVYFETELGKGRPGWHIECSVMCYKYLGETIDIHMGGIDLKFPHHENEIAQSEAFTGKKFVNIWLHSNMLNIESKKMSKRYGNIYSLRDIMKKSFSPLALKLYFFSANYNTAMDFYFDVLKDYQEKLNYYNNTISRLLNYFSESKRAVSFDDLFEKIISALEDNLNSALAIKRLDDFFAKINSEMKLSFSKESANKAIELIKKLDEIFAVFCFKKVPKTVFDKAKERYFLRKKKNFSESDAIREELKKDSYIIYDYKDGFSIIDGNVRD